MLTSPSNSQTRRLRRTKGSAGASFVSGPRAHPSVLPKPNSLHPSPQPVFNSVSRTGAGGECMGVWSNGYQGLDSRYSTLLPVQVLPPYSPINPFIPSAYDYQLNPTLPHAPHDSRQRLQPILAATNAKSFTNQAVNIYEHQDMAEPKRPVHGLHSERYIAEPCTARHSVMMPHVFSGPLVPSMITTGGYLPTLIPLNVGFPPVSVASPMVDPGLVDPNQFRGEMPWVREGRVDGDDESGDSQHLPQESFDPPFDHDELEASEERGVVETAGKRSLAKKLTREERKERVERYRAKRKTRNWKKEISYACRRQVAQKRLRIRGRFGTKEQVYSALGIKAEDLEKNAIIRTLVAAKNSSIVASINNVKIRNIQNLVDFPKKSAQARKDPREGSQVGNSNHDKILTTEMQLADASRNGRNEVIDVQIGELPRSSHAETVPSKTPCDPRVNF